MNRDRVSLIHEIEKKTQQHHNDGGARKKNTYPICVAYALFTVAHNNLF